MVLSRQTSICKIFRDSLPFAQTSIIEHLQFIGYNKWHNAVTQALFEHNQTPDTTIAILKRMDRFKLLIKI